LSPSTPVGRVERTYGMPFRGCVSSVDRHEVPIDCLGGESREVLVDPNRVEGAVRMKRRQGTTSISANTGLLDMTIAQATMRGLDVYPLVNPAYASQYPLPSVLFVDEDKRYGQVFVNDSVDYTEGSEFGSTHYPTSASTANQIKMPPLPYDGNGATGYMRLASEEQRRRTVAGSRNRLGIGNWDYYGGFLSTPSRSNREYNISSASGTNLLRRLPTGLIPPLWIPTAPAASYPTRKTTAAPWGEGDTMFYTVAFENEDGSVSMPCIPRDINSVLTSGFGLVVVNDDGDATVEYLDYIPLRDIPKGPAGTKARRIYRTDKVTKTEVAAGAWPDLSTLKLCAIIEDNTTTSYNDALGSNDGPVTDSKLRLDQIWAPRHRYSAAFDQRHIIGYVRPTACALVVAPSGVTTSRDLNETDNATPGATLFMVQIREDTSGAKTLYLRKSSFGASVPTNTTISLLSSTTLQTVVDTITAMTTASTGGEWVCQLVPGTNAAAPSDNLAATQISVGTCTTTLDSPNVSTVNSHDFANVAEGMLVYHANFPAGTYVKTKTSDTALVLSANATATAAGTATLEFYVNTGDDACFTDAAANSQNGNIRGYWNSYPVIIGFTQAYLDTFATAKRDFLVTTAGPTGVPNAANIFHTSPGGRHQLESAAGIIMGFAPLKRGCVVFCSERIGYYSNTRSGGTGADEDYRLEWIDFAHGCKSPYSIVYGNNWVGCWRDDGFWIFDGQEAAIISGDHFDPGRQLGELVYEALQCANAAADDTNDYYMMAHYADGRLWLAYRYQELGSTMAAMVCYDSSPSINASGLRQMLRSDGAPYGWSSRLTYTWRGFSFNELLGAIGSVRDSGGLTLYVTDDTNDRTDCGLLMKFEVEDKWQDGSGTYIVPKFYGTMDFMGGLKKFALANNVTVLYKFTTSNGGASLLLSLYRNQVRTGGGTMSLGPSSATDVLSRVTRPAPLQTQSPGEILEWYLTLAAPASGDTDVELSGILVDADVLDSLN